MIIHAMQKISDKLLETTLVKPLFNTLTHRVFEYFFDDYDLEFLNQKRVCIHCSTFDLAVCYSRTQGKMVVLPAKDWDVKISTSLTAMLSLICDDTDADTLLFNRKLKIEGDTALGLTCKNMLDSFDRNKLPNYALGLVANVLHRRQS